VTPFAPPVSDQDYERFRRLVDEKSGMDLPPARRIDLQRAIARALAETGLSDTLVLYQRLRGDRDRAELESFISLLTVGETHFFRNRPQFDALEKHILPEVIRRRSHERRLRIWSAGCSSGEEPYSLAMLLERLIPDLAEWNLLIIATDMDREALKKAYRATYGPWSFRDVPAHIRSQYFTSHGREFQVVPHIREMVTFEYLNLVEDSYPSLLTNTNAMDLILCRNVLIYFRENVSRSVVARLYDAIVDDGWLLVGHAEPSQSIFERFSVQNFPGTIVYRKSRGKTVLTPTTSDRGRVPDSSRRSNAHRNLGPCPSVDRRQAVDAEGDDPCEDALKLWVAGHMESALSALENAAMEHPSDARAPYLIAKLQAGRLHMDAAEFWITEALGRDHFFAPAHYLRGLMMQEEDRSEDALESLRRCVYSDPRWPLGHFALAGSLLRLGHCRRAATALDNVKQLLEGRPADEPIPEGEGLTVGRLLELAQVQKEIFALQGSAEAREL
jgi:chemotaxis protein methyltransferase CheR